MSDFGSRGGGVGATAAKQDVQETSLNAIQAADEALTKQANFKPVDAVRFYVWLQNYTSEAINCAGYRKFLLRINLTVANTPGNIKINVQFSHGGGTYENYTRGPFGSLMYEDTAGAKSECIEGECLGPKMKINVLATDIGEFDEFTLTCKVILTR